MNSLARFSRVPVVVVSLLLLLVVAVVAGCAPDANSALLAPDLGPKLVMAQSEGAIVIEPTAVPPKLAELAADEITAGLEPAVQEALANANPSNGETIALTFGCIGCHAVDPTEVRTGPTWHNAGDTAVVRVPGESPAEYLYISIVAPNDYIVPGYPGNIMPANFNELMTTEQIADMVAYLLQLNGQE